MSGKTIWLCVGLAGGVLLTLLVQVLLAPAETQERADTQQQALAQRLVDQTAELDRTRSQLAEAQTHAAAVTQERDALKQKLAEAGAMEPEPAGKPAEGAGAPEPPAELTDKEILAQVSAFGSALGSIIRGSGDVTAQLDALHEMFERGGPRVVKFLAAKLDDDTVDISTRSLVAHALAQSGNPDAIAVLEAMLEDPDKGMLAHRLASHGLAFSPAEGVESVLLKVARDEAMDSGARANSAFGAARRGSEEGIGLYMGLTDKALASGDPAGLQYLGGVMLLGPKVLPQARQRLLTYTEPQSLLLLIEILKQKRDKDAVPNLEQLAYDAHRPESVQKAAQAALQVLK